MHRRSFLGTIAVILHALAAIVVGAPALQYLLAPLRRKRRNGSDGIALTRYAGFVRTIPVSTLPVSKPMRVAIEQDRWDGFTHYPPGTIGHVWLYRESDTLPPAERVEAAVPPAIRCWQTVCPHLGCAIDDRNDHTGFHCPCHGARFDLSGASISGPSPRGMDELRCRISDADADGLRWIEVRYEEFLTGIPNKQARA